MKQKALKTLAAALFLGVVFCLSLNLAAARVNKVTFYFPGNTPREIDAALKEINRRTVGEIETEVVFNFIPWGDYTSKINSLLAAGDTYEAHFDADWFMYPNLAARGALLPLDDLLPKYAPNIWRKISKDSWQGAKFGGKILAIPWKYPKSERRVMIIREDLRKKYGVPPIKTLDDLEVYLEAIRGNEPGMIPNAATKGNYINAQTYIGGYSTLNWVWEIIYRWDDPKSTLVALEQTDWYKEMARRVRRQYLKGYFEKDVLAQKEDPKVLLQIGKGASFMHVYGTQVTLNQETKAQHPNWEFAGYPLHPEKVAPLAPVMNNSLVFNVNGAHPENALMFWEWVHKNQENYDLVLYGIKGRHYTLVEGGTVKLPEGVSLADSPYMGWHGQWAAWWEEYKRPEVGEPPGWMEDYLRVTNLNEKYWPLTGFAPNLEPIKTELAQRSAVMEEMGYALSLGVIDPDRYLSEYIQKQKRAGIDKILSVLQKQVDEFLAQKR